MNKSSSSSSSAIIALASVCVAVLVVLATVCAPIRADDELTGSQEPRELESIANARVQSGPSDLASAASHHGHSHGKYYMYAESPKKGAYKMGFKRGNEKHMIERKESVHKGHVESYFKWHDKKGKGSHKFEYKHKDSKKKHY